MTSNLAFAGGQAIGLPAPDPNRRSHRRDALERGVGGPQRARAVGDFYERSRDQDAPAFNSLLEREPLEKAAPALDDAERRYEEAAGASAVPRQKETDDALKMEDVPAVGFRNLARSIRDWRYKKYGSDGDAYRAAVANRTGKSYCDFETLWAEQDRKAAEQKATAARNAAAQSGVAPLKVGLFDVAPGGERPGLGGPSVGAPFDPRSILGEKGGADGETVAGAAAKGLARGLGSAVTEPLSNLGRALTDYGDIAQGAVDPFRTGHVADVARGLGAVGDGLRKRFPDSAISRYLPTNDPDDWKDQREEAEEAFQARADALRQQLHGVAEDAEIVAKAVQQPRETARKAYEQGREIVSGLSDDERRRQIVEQLAESLARGAAQRFAGRLLGGLLGKGRPGDKLPGDDGASRMFPEKGPYDPKGTREALEEKYGEKAVTSTTVPHRSDKGMTFQNKSGEEAMRAGEPSPVVGAPNPKTGRLYDRRGEPNLDADTRASADIPKPTRNSRRRAVDKRQAIKELQQMLRDNPQMRARFRQEQLDAIDAGKPDIPDLVWDHDRWRGRLKSVRRRPHEENVHVGRLGMDNNGKGR